MNTELKTISELAEEHGVYRATISDLIRKLGIPDYPVPRTGSGRGLDRRGQQKLARVLGRRKSEEVTS